MKSTDPKRIADYDAKNGAGAYSKKLQEKLNKIYTPEKAKQLTQSKVKPMSTGKVVGRENLSPKAQKALARLDAQKAGFWKGRHYAGGWETEIRTVLFPARDLEIEGCLAGDRPKKTSLDCGTNFHRSGAWCRESEL